MKAFRYRLDGVLRIRRFELERERARLAALEAEHRRGTERVRELRARIDRGEAALRGELGHGVDGRRVSLHQLGLATGRFGLARAEANLEAIVPRLERARARVREARVRVRSLERLRERRAEAHRRDAMRLEQAELDDLAIVRSLRDGHAAAEAPTVAPSVDGVEGMR